MAHTAYPNLFLRLSIPYPATNCMFLCHSTSTKSLKESFGSEDQFSITYLPL